MKGQFIRETEYCGVMKQGTLDKGTHISKIERIYVKKKQEEEIRFCYYKPTENGGERFITRPLDLNEEEMFELLSTAIDNDVFSDEFKKKLKDKLS
ncbi:hypothetical protein WKH56_20455 [Priestia sp. SB1]|uniref:hypothetical protein n=1 Tax=Priestia sp. SB1 TaxID=3132359 RepID=UPI00316E9535